MSVRVRIADLSSDQKKQIARELLFQPKLTFFQKQKGISVDSIAFYLIQGEHIFLPYVYYGKMFNRHPNSWIQYPRYTFTFTGELLKHQISIANEAAQQMKQYGTTLLNVYTGCGKTVLSAFLSTKAQLKTLVLFNATILNSQWEDTFKTLTDAKVWVVDPSKKLPDYEPDIIICMTGRVNKIPEEWRRNVGTLIIDECHLLCTPTSVGPLLKFQPKYIIACSATPTKASGMELMIQASIGTHNVYRPLDKPFRVTEFRTGIVPVMPEGKTLSDFGDVMTSLSQNHDRNQQILQWVLSNPGRKILILTWRSEHARTLQKLIQSYNVKTAVMVGNNKSYSDSPVLVGGIKKIGTGFDEKSKCPDFSGMRINMLLLVGSMKDENLLFQLAGRCFRSELPQIIDFVDEVPFIKKSHWPTREAWYIRNGGTMDIFLAPGAEKKAVKKRAKKKVQQSVEDAFLQETIEMIKYSMSSGK